MDPYNGKLNIKSLFKTSSSSDETSSENVENVPEDMDTENDLEPSKARKKLDPMMVLDKEGNQNDPLKPIPETSQSRCIVGSGRWEISEQLNDGPMRAKVLAARRFCALCETPIESEDFGSHLLAEPHKGGDDRVYMFNDESVVVAPLATKVTKETARCGTCFGMFFRCRVETHSCPFKIDDDTPLRPQPTLEVALKRFYCLMCQIRFETQPMLLRHWREFHNENPNSYIIDNIRGLETLHPATINYDEALQFCCDYCQEFAYKGRTPPLCKKAAYNPFKYRSVTLNEEKGSCK